MSKKSITQDWHDPDDAPDLSTPEWQEKIAKVAVKRGRPKSAQVKTLTTLRLDKDVIEHFQSQGPGWQTRINDTLRKSLKRKSA